MGRVRRRLIRVIRYFVVRPAAAVGLVVALVALVGVAAILPRVVSGPGLAVAPALPGVNLASAPPPGGEPAATQDFIRGNQQFDAALIWRSFSDEARAQLQQNGGSLDALQRQMEAARQSGVTFEDISYIGGKVLPNGTSKQLYLVGLRQEASPEIEYVSFMFTLDRSGKIVQVQ